MWATSSDYLKRIRAGGGMGAVATFRDLYRPTLPALPIDIEDLSWSVDGDSLIRRTLTISAPPSERLWQAFDSPGGEITVSRFVQYTDRSTESVPVGTFVVDQDQLGYKPTDTLQMTCPDRGSIVQGARFRPSEMASVPGNTISQELARLIVGAFTSSYRPFPGWAPGSPDMSAIDVVPTTVWTDGERANAIADLEDVAGMQAGFTANGLAFLRRRPVATTASSTVFTLDAAVNGVMIGADRTRDRSVARNAVVVTYTGSDVYLNQITVSNDNPADPLSTVGPLGFRPIYLSSSTFTSYDQMHAAGVTLLGKQLGMASQISIEAAPNDALDADDVVLALLPVTDETLPRPAEVHIVQTIQASGMPNGTMQIQTRATRPTSDDSSS